MYKNSKIVFDLKKNFYTKNFKNVIQQNLIFFSSKSKKFTYLRSIKILQWSQVILKLISK